MLEHIAAKRLLVLNDLAALIYKTVVAYTTSRVCKRNIHSGDQTFASVGKELCDASILGGLRRMGSLHFSRADLKFPIKTSEIHLSCMSFSRGVSQGLSV